MVELGRSCVHASHRQGGVILALWGALAEFMQRNRLDAMVGCASIPMQYPGLAHGEARRASGSNCARPIWPSPSCRCVPAWPCPRSWHPSAPAA